MILAAYLPLLSAILLSVLGQLLLKRGMLQQPGFQISELLLLLRNGKVVSGFICYGLSVLLYFSALDKLALSVAFPTVSLGYVLVIILSKVFFQEAVTQSRWLAAAIICLGVALIGFT